MKSLIKKKQSKNKSLALPHIRSLAGKVKSSGDKSGNNLALKTKVKPLKNYLEMSDSEFTKMKLPKGL